MSDEKVAYNVPPRSLSCCLKQNCFNLTISDLLQVSWDHGPEGSIAEDAFFALVAWAKGYKFGFIPG